MAVKSGSFVSRSGKTYRVEFQGESVKSGGIKFAVPPVVISMAAGEHKFCGFKSTTATINILTDEPLIDLYASTITSINVKITEDSECIFNGYVTPFAFDQSYTGKADAVTVQAIDSLTVRKDVTYTNIGDVHGVDKTGRDIVQAICQRAGVTKIVQHLNFNDTNDVMKSASPLDVMVAQAGFLQDEVSDCDALSAICKFFGYTGHLIGETLYLYDEHCLGNITDANVYTYSSGGWSFSSHFYNNSGSPLALQTVGETHNDISITIERAYDGIQITPEGSEVSVLLPDVCADENMSVIEGAETYPISNDTGQEDRVERDSHVMTFALGAPDYVVRDDWNGAALLMNVVRLKRYGFNAGDDEVTIWGKESSKNYIRVRPQTEWNGDSVVYGQQWSGCAYSHTGGFARLNFKFRILAIDDWRDTDKVIDKGDSANSITLVSVGCGDKRLFSDYAIGGGHYNIWKSKAEYAGGTGIAFKGDDLLPTGVAQSLMADGFIIEPPSNGVVTVDLTFAGWPMFFVRHEYLIEELSLEGYGEPIDPAALSFNFKGSRKEKLEVSTMLTTRWNGVTDISRMRVNARPGVVTGNWKAGYNGGTSTDIPIAGVLMEQLKARYGQPHAAYKMTSRKNIKPFAAVEWNGNTYTVEAYDRDLYDDTTTITID